MYILKPCTNYRGTERTRPFNSVAGPLDCEQNMTERRALWYLYLVCNKIVVLASVHDPIYIC